MNKDLPNLTEFMKMPVVGIVRNISMDDFREILPLYFDAGLRNIEVTMNTANATEMIRYANKHFEDKLVIGAGTVCTAEDLEQAINAGSKFIVTPITDESIIQTCVEKRIPIMPGALTPTEIFKAWKASASIVKLFPATSLGVQYISDIRGPLNQIKLMPTGGITLKNVASFFKAGASAVGVGSKLFDTKMIADKNWKELSVHFKSFVSEVKSSQVKS